MYENYIFDLYGTLVDIKTDEKSPDLWNKMSEIYSFNGAFYEPQELRETYTYSVEAEYKAIASEHPEITYVDINIDSVFRFLYRHKGVEADSRLTQYTAETFRVISTEYLKLYDGVPELLQLLKDKDKKIFLLSNAQRLFTFPELRHLKIDSFFDGIVISSDVLCSKPDPVIFKHLFDSFDIEPKKSIMIGNDSSSDIAGASFAKMDSLYIHSNISPSSASMPNCKYVVENGDVNEIAKVLELL